MDVDSVIFNATMIYNSFEHFSVLLKSFSNKKNLYLHKISQL